MNRKIDNRIFYKKLLLVAIPIAVENLIASSLNLVDNIMVGVLGEAELAAVGVGIQLFQIYWLACFGFVSGVSTYAAQFWGAQKLDKIRFSVGVALKFTIVVSALFFIACYFFTPQMLRIFTDIPEVIECGTPYVRMASFGYLFNMFIIPFDMALKSTQQAHLPLLASGLSFGLNTFLNYVLIFGVFGAPELGVAGAGIATSIARGVQFAVLIYIIFVRKNVISGNIKEFLPRDKVLERKIIKNSIPTTINELMWGMGNSAFVAAYARISVTAYASVQAASTIQQLLMMTAFSLADASLILIGQKLGEGKRDEAIALAHRLTRIAFIVSVVAAVLLVLVSKPIVNVFALTDIGKQYAFYVIIVYAIFLPVSLYNGVLVAGILRSGGDTRYAMVSEISCQWIIGVPLAFVSALLWGIPIYWCVVCANLNEIAKFIILFRRYRSGKWAKTVVD